MVRPPRSTAEPSLHGVQEGRVRSSIIPPWAAALLLFATATTADAETVLRYDAIGATGGYVGGKRPGVAGGQPVIGPAGAGGGAIIQNRWGWRPPRPQLVGGGGA